VGKKDQDKRHFKLTIELIRSGERIIIAFLTSAAIWGCIGAVTIDYINQTNARLIPPTTPGISIAIAPTATQSASGATAAATETNNEFVSIAIHATGTAYAWAPTPTNTQVFLNPVTPFPVNSVVVATKPPANAVALAETPTVGPIVLQEIVVVVQQIPRGMRIPQSAVDTRLWPKIAIPKGAITNVADIAGKVACDDIYIESPVFVLGTCVQG